MSFCPNSLTERVHKLWEEARFAPIGLRDARHSFASFLIAAGVNPKAIQTYMRERLRKVGQR
jgi:hypothetical protein